MAVLAEGLRKTFDKKAALDGIDLTVPAGTVCGLLGPNGAGKTTAVRILATLLRLDGGRAEVAGFDVVRDAAEVRRRVGLNGQQSTVDAVLTGRENLVMWGRLYHLSRRQAERRADELLEQFGLTDAAGKRAKTYSGGMRRRLDLASSFIMAPQVLFLDEPTTGLDPRNRGEVWREVKRLVAEGTTVLLTTQYLDEADQLADQIVVLDSGKVVADGPPDQLKSKLGGDRIEVVVRSAGDLGAAARILGAAAEVDADNFRVSAAVEDRVAALTRVTRDLADAGVEAEDIALRRPTLDEVFLTLTGHKAVAA
ncbi:daunorubicin resistance protein DrrA family ABC transporter ATP-binding protein [Lentzea sp. NBRC 105346]|uniref:ATP-binding cassette domain-containing protein n=1 Tax=Lentzea sp. NBRC 105346 TaxID=3032205 RepID=UPI0024A59DFA|nr:ATP-binding cassette domain-containing protein [Lentzea sp. NBRC 105346]GLZ34142.1 daunorubicin resistance protein DrrA family ABC transporter ATP-binding protein [Lentzea sp. NBRC 105346]